MCPGGSLSSVGALQRKREHAGKKSAWGSESLPSIHEALGSMVVSPPAITGPLQEFDIYNELLELIRRK